jgi:hypothetical protein
MSRAFRVLLAASAVMALAACGHQSSTTEAAGAAGAANATGAAAGAAGAQTPKQRAEAESAALLRAFVPPPGATRLAGPPDLPGGVLKNPVTVLVNATQARGLMFWEAPGEPQAVLAWEVAHIAKRFTLGDADFGPPAWDRMFQLPPVPGVITSQDMVVEVASMGNGKTGIRVDSEVAWQPARLASAKVPSAAKVVTISMDLDFAPTYKHAPAPVTITNPAIVRGLAALVNALSVSPFNDTAANCPAPFGVGLELTFRAKPSGQSLAQAQTDQPCGVTVFTIPGDKPLSLNNATDQRILAVAGLHWKLSRP